MPLTASILEGLVIGSHVSRFPTCKNAKNNGKVIPFEIISSLCQAWCDVFQQENIFQTDYSGVAGTTVAVAPPTPFVFLALPASVAGFLAAAGWSGTASVGVATTFIFDVANYSSIHGKLNFTPVPAASAGVGTPNSSIAASSSIFTTQFQSAIRDRLSERTDESGNKLFDLSTPELSGLIINLSNSYATIMSSIFFTGAFVGTPTGATAPISLVTTGSVI